MKHYMEEDLLKYIDGDSDKESEAILQAHLKHCRRCMDRYEELYMLDAELHQLAPEQPSAQFTNAIIEELYPATRKQARVSFNFFGGHLMIFGIVAALLILLVSMAYLGFLDTPVPSEWVGSPAALTMVSKGLLGASIIAMLLLLDKALLTPFFKKRREEKMTFR